MLTALPWPTQTMELATADVLVEACMQQLAA